MFSGERFFLVHSGERLKNLQRIPITKDNQIFVDMYGQGRSSFNKIL